MNLERGPRRGDLFDVTIEEVTAQGLGQGSFDALVGPQQEPRTYTVFARKAVPGDLVRVRVEETRRSRITAQIVEMLEPSPMRITPRCRHFGLREQPGRGCGGCTLQSLSYRHQLAIKERTIKRLMQSAGIDPGLVYPVIGMDDPWYYRNKMEFSFGDDARREFALGLHPTGFKYEILNLEECFLESEFVSALVPAVRQWAIDNGLEAHLTRPDRGFLRNLTVREGKRTGERMVELVTTADEQVAWRGGVAPARDVAQSFSDFVVEFARGQGAADGAADTRSAITTVYWTQYHVARGERTRLIEHHLYGLPALHEELELPGERRLRFEIHPRAFFQPNSLGAEMLYSLVIDRTGLRSTDAGGAGGGATVLDLYCGTGTIGLCLAPYAAKVLGIELQPDAVDNARRNAVYNGIENVEFFVGDVGKVLGSEEFRAASGDRVDIVVVDPPRAGLTAEAIEHVLAVGAPTLVYVSCGPQALARDLRLLTEQGYRIDSIQPVDLFPQTFHVENIALLRR